MIVEALLALQLGGGSAGSISDGCVTVGAERKESPAPILCPAYPGDDPWRWMTCYIWTRMGEPPDRPSLRNWVR